MNPRNCVGPLATLLALLACQAPGFSQGTFQWFVTFDGPPPIAPDSAIGINYYSEEGMIFTPITSEAQFTRNGGGGAGWPSNGTAYLQALLGDSLAITESGHHFGLVSVDLAEYSYLFQTPTTVQFIGYKADGSTLTTEFVTDGIMDGTGPLPDFQTFSFDSRFNDLVRVEIPNVGWSLDNMVFSLPVPEPGACALIALGFALATIRLSKPSSKHPSRRHLKQR